MFLTLRAEAPLTTTAGAIRRLSSGGRRSDAEAPGRGILGERQYSTNQWWAVPELKAGILTSRLGEIFEPHVIDPKSLRGDDFDKFFEKRRIQLLKRIELAMGKPVAEDLANAKNQN